MRSCSISSGDIVEEREDEGAARAKGAEETGRQKQVDWATKLDECARQALEEAATSKPFSVITGNKMWRF